MPSKAKKKRATGLKTLLQMRKKGPVRKRVSGAAERPLKFEFTDEEMDLQNRSAEAAARLSLE